MKAIILAVLIVFTLAVDPLANLKAAVKENTCASETLKNIKPEIDAKLAELKKDQQNDKLQVEVIALMEKGRKMLEACDMKFEEPIVGDKIEATGVAFMLASNCFKDVGIVLILADTVVQSPKDWVNDVMIAIFGYILGNTAKKDCKQFIHFII